MQLLSPRSGRPVVLVLLAAIGMVTTAAAIYLWAHRVVAVPGMIYYPGGAFPFGPNKKPVNLGPFYIDETEVSNAEYAEFCRATGCAPLAGAPDLLQHHVQHQRAAVAQGCCHGAGWLGA